MKLLAVALPFALPRGRRSLSLKHGSGQSSKNEEGSKEVAEFHGEPPEFHLKQHAQGADQGSLSHFE